MRVAGIIAECNPFHEGHAHLLQKARERTGADYVIVALSGDYVQRGAPAILPWEERVPAILASGADLVVALPLFVSCGGADYFARGAVSLLRACGVVTDLCFGSESADLASLKASASALSLISEGHGGEYILASLREGLPFPAARAKALEAAGVSAPKGSNDILAAEYLKELARTGSPVVPHCIPLLPCPSASDRRKAMKGLRRDDFSQALMHALTAGAPVRSCLDVSEDLANRIGRLLPQYQTYSQFCALLKNRSLTYTRISRSLLHITLGMTDADMGLLEKHEMCGWIRPLGFRRSCGPLLAAIQENCTAPWLGRLSEASAVLDQNLYGLLEKEMQAELLYDFLAAAQNGFKNRQEIRRAMQKPLILDSCRD